LEKKKAENTAAKKENKDGGKVTKQKFLMYKDKPLVRSGKILYYGDMKDPYVVMLQILSTKEVGEMQIADKVQIQLMSTDSNLRTKDRIIKKAERNGLFNAMDVGAVWLQRALDEPKN